MNFPFILPPTQKDDPLPQWTGNAFQVGDETTKVLQYSSNDIGWSDELTSFHEDNAGENHFIDKASRKHALVQISKFTTKKEFPVILEIGCSSGYMLKKIKRAYPNAMVIGADVVYEPLVALAEEIPNTPLLRFDLLKCPLPDNCVDAVVMLNVLEHIEDDAAAMTQVRRILKPGGIAVLEVPAGPHLYDIYDKALNHYRRYTLKNFKNLLQDAKFKIHYKSHLGFFLYPGFAFVKKRNQKKINMSAAEQKQLVEKNIKNTGENKLLHAIMNFELLLGNYISYALGIRCLVTCSK